VREFFHYIKDRLTWQVYSKPESRSKVGIPAKVNSIPKGSRTRNDRTCLQTVQSLAIGTWESVRHNSAIALSSILSVVDRMATLPGRRVLVMASSGFLSGTLEFEREVIINHALRGSVVINSLDAKGLFSQDMGITNGLPFRSMIARQSQGTRVQWENSDVMAILAAGTGGLFFHNNNDLDLGFRELGLLPEFSYSFGFVPRGGA
jgi:hypothetical protein